MSTQSLYDMNGKTVFITGATSGIGRLTATKLAAAGAEVLIHGRSEEKLNEAINEIKEATGNQNIRGYIADLVSMKQVKGLTEEILSKEKKLDVIINNAGVLGPRDADRKETDDGFELLFQVNYLATVLITKKLLPLIEESKGRVVNLASAAQTPIDPDHLMESSGGLAYAHSKLSVVLYSFYLAEQLKDKNVSIFALDPGSLLNTNMEKEAFGASDRSPEIGADAQMQLACSPDLKGVTGKFYCELNESKANDQAYDLDIQKRLWDKTEELLSNHV